MKNFMDTIHCCNVKKLKPFEKNNSLRKILISKKTNVSCSKFINGIRTFAYGRKACIDTRMRFITIYNSKSNKLPIILGWDSLMENILHELIFKKVFKGCCSSCHWPLPLTGKGQWQYSGIDLMATGDFWQNYSGKLKNYLCI